MGKKTGWHEADIEKLVTLRLAGRTWVEISAKFPGSTPNMVRKAFYRETRDKKTVRPLKILCFDIETSPLVVFSWSKGDVTISDEMIIENFSVLSWSAKWVGAPTNTVMYDDVRGQKNLRDDKRILQGIWNLLDEADIVLSQNGKRFDVKKLNARFIKHGMKPPSKYGHIDTLLVSRKHFAFDSHKLGSMTDQLCTKFKKSGHKKFPGFSLWRECMNGNIEAFKEMEDYNKMDVLSLEELYVDHLRVWDDTLNFNVFHDEEMEYCSCGSTDFLLLKDKYVTTKVSRLQQYRCKSCGKLHTSRENLLTKDKKKALMK